MTNEQYEEILGQLFDMNDWLEQLVMIARDQRKLDDDAGFQADVIEAIRQASTGEPDFTPVTHTIVKEMEG